MLFCKCRPENQEVQWSDAISFIPTDEHQRGVLEEEEEEEVASHGGICVPAAQLGSVSRVAGPKREGMSGVVFRVGR
ncbi:unnamed protein product [Arctogadus glacialis]